MEDYQKCKWDGCGAMVPQNQLLNHIKSDHITGRNGYTCRWRDCSSGIFSEEPKVWVKSSHFSAHLVTHSTYAPYPCPIAGCCYRTKRQNDMSKHLKRKHHTDSQVPQKKEKPLHPIERPQATWGTVETCNWLKYNGFCNLIPFFQKNELDGAYLTNSSWIESVKGSCDSFTVKDFDNALYLLSIAIDNDGAELIKVSSESGNSIETYGEETSHNMVSGSQSPEDLSLANRGQKRSLDGLDVLACLATATSESSETLIESPSEEDGPDSKRLNYILSGFDDNFFCGKLDTGDYDSVLEEWGIEQVNLLEKLLEDITGDRSNFDGCIDTSEGTYDVPCVDVSANTTPATMSIQSEAELPISPILHLEKRHLDYENTVEKPYAYGESCGKTLPCKENGDEMSSLHGPSAFPQAQCRSLDLLALVDAAATSRSVASSVEETSSVAAATRNKKKDDAKDVSNRPIPAPKSSVLHSFRSHESSSNATKLDPLKQSAPSNLSTLYSFRNRLSTTRDSSLKSEESTLSETKKARVSSSDEVDCNEKMSAIADLFITDDMDSNTTGHDLAVVITSVTALLKRLSKLKKKRKPL